MSELESDAETASSPLLSPRGSTPCIIGIGASAGGLESLERLFDGILQPICAAFVVIQHLSPNHETMMDQLLARHTTMPVSIAVDGQAIVPNRVYVIPPKKDMIVRDGRLVLTDQVRAQVPHLPIDLFFGSMADECGDRCAAIVLSGTGSDGSQGVRKVHAAGGLALSESEATAKFSGMPRSAEATGCVHEVVPPEAMGGLLESRFATATDTSDREPASEDLYHQIFTLMRQHCQVDFAQYKRSTVSRRIERRMAACRIDSLAEYTQRLRGDADEVQTLYRDMLIGVTKFFRDANCFEYLQSEVIPKLIANANPTEGLRIWVPGCATGEEAYSLAILFDEARSQIQPQVDVKIFASDVHPDSLQVAGRGRYSEDKLSNVSPQRLARYFEHRGHHYTVTKAIRQMVLFAPHSVLQDPPFTGLDMVSCRNLLIYFDVAAQQKALTLFHFGLKKDGVLFLGPSETISGISHEFLTLSEHCKVYSKRRDARLPTDIRLPISLQPRGVYDAMRRPRTHGDGRNQHQLYDCLLDNLLPPTLLVNESRRVLETFGGAEKLLQFRGRRVSTDLFELCPPELQTSLSAALRRAESGRQAVRLPVSDVPLMQQERCDLEILVRPIQHHPDQPWYYAIQFLVRTPRVANANDSSPWDDSATDQMRELTESDQRLTARVHALEDELGHSRENLQTTVEQLETSNEELQATNEELIASNEELQSTNEELHTVNVEYQRKNTELRELNEDMNHLLASTDIGTIFLDEALTIRRITPRIVDVFNLEPQDVGRSISSFTHRLEMNDLRQRLTEVLADGVAYEREVRDTAGNHYFLRILPYRVEQEIAGVVLTLTDIGKLVESRKLVEKYQRHLQDAIDAVPVFVSFVNQEQCYEYANLAYTKWLDVLPEQIIGKPVRNVLGEAAYRYSKPYIERALRGEAQVFEQELDTVHGRIAISVHYLPCRDKQGQVVGFYVSAADITSLKSAEMRLAEAVEASRQANQAKSDFLAKMSHEIRSPMTAIIGFADILDQQLKIPDNRNCVEIIRKNGYHLLELINDILDLSRIESGKFDLEAQSFPPSELFKECYNSVIPRASENLVQIHLDTRCGLDENLLADRRRLRQVVLNLLTNAVKFAQGGQVVLRGLRLRRSHQFVITVADTGCGISAGDLPKMFEPFSQSDNSDSRKYEGTGLGLTITKQLVEQMSGQMLVRSRVGQGTVFRVKLPWQDGPRVVAGAHEPIELRSSIPRLDGRRILVIDDRRDIRFIAEHILSDAGATVDTAENGQQGIELTLQQHACGNVYDCIVTDIQMPEMDGYETTRQLRSRGFSGPILALTASAMTSDRDRCLESGCNAHIPKPIGRIEFVRTIRQLLDGQAVG